MGLFSSNAFGVESFVSFDLEVLFRSELAFNVKYSARTEVIFNL